MPRVIVKIRKVGTTVALGRREKRKRGRPSGIYEVTFEGKKVAEGVGKKYAKQVASLYRSFKRLRPDSEKIRDLL